MIRVLDSNHCIALERGAPGATSRLRTMPDAERIVISAVTYAELLYGLMRMPDGKRKRAAERANALLIASVSDITPVAADVAEDCARLRLELSLAGTPIPANDLWIAATARCHGWILVTHDRHFHCVPGLALEDWLR